MGVVLGVDWDTTSEFEVNDPNGVLRKYNHIGCTKAVRNPVTKVDTLFKQWRVAFTNLRTNVQYIIINVSLKIVAFIGCVIFVDWVGFNDFIFSFVFFVSYLIKL